MAQIIMKITDGTLKFADSQGGLGAGTDRGEQVTSGMLVAVPASETVPATFRTAAVSVPATTGYEVSVSFLQDWTSSTGLSKYLYDNDGELKWFQLTPDDDTSGTKIEGECYIVAADLGGGGSSPLQATVTLPCKGKPTLSVA